MFILRAKRNKQGKGIKARDDRIVFHHRHRVFGSGATAPQNLKKNTGQGDSRALAVTGLR